MQEVMNFITSYKHIRERDGVEWGWGVGRQFESFIKLLLTSRAL